MGLNANCCVRVRGLKEWSPVPPTPGEPERKALNREPGGNVFFVFCTPKLSFVGQN